MSSFPVSWRKVAVFVFLAYGLAWALAFIFFVAGGKVDRTASPGFLLFGLGYMFMPTVAAVVTQRCIWKEPLRELGLNRPRWSWMLVAWLAPVAIVLLALGLSVLMPRVSLGAGLETIYREAARTLTAQQLSELHRMLDASPLGWPGVLPMLMLAQVLIAGASINAVAALGEELGWRGFMWSELAPVGFWRASLIIGLVWGIWHLPLIAAGYNYPGYPIAGPAMMTLLTILLAPLIGYVRVRARSIFAAAVFHGTFNAAATLAVLLRNGDPMLTGMTGVTGVTVLAFANLALWWFTQRSKRLSLYPLGAERNVSFE